ncbi:MAG: DUF861 domain-containing protein [Ectothiorhodospiraceae bacterium]|nr:DUF861 domain-containing protein [Chromatiales bacterium]MCP5157661.1 DUF861 domain-containing protein [Ectothiorhodospiraceae bacterium]
MSTIAIPSVVGATDMALTPAGRRAGADRGDPQVSARSLHDDGETKVGVWECTPGGWPIVDRADTEVATILSGRATITDADGSTRVIGAGSVLTLPKGWSGRWDVTETLRKVYVIVK